MISKALESANKKFNEHNKKKIELNSNEMITLDLTNQSEVT